MIVLALPLAFATLIAPSAGGTTYESATGLLPIVDAAAVDRLSELLPADAFLVMRARSVTKVLADINLLMGNAADSPERITTADLLDPLDSSEIAATIALDRPIGIAMTFGVGGQPQVTAALPVIDAAAALAALPKNQPDLHALAAGDYLVVSSSAEFQLPTGTSALIAGLPMQDLIVHVDVAAVMAKFRPMIDMGIEQAEIALDEIETQPGQPDTAALSEQSFDIARAFMDSAQTLQLSLDELHGRLRFAGHFTVKDGSPMSKWYTGERRDLARLAGLVDPAAAFVAMSSCNPQVQARSALEWMDSVAESMPENVRELIDLERRVWREMLPKTGGMNAMSIDLSVDGLKGLSYIEALEPQALIESVRSFLAAPELAKFGMQLEGPTAREIDGTTWSEYRMALDIETFARAFDPDVQVPASDKADADHAIAAFLGEGGLRLGVAASNGFLVMRVNGDDNFARRAIARLGGSRTSLGSGLDDALADARFAQTAYVAQIDIGRVLNQISDLAAVLGHDPEIPVALLGSSFPVTFHGAVDGLIWRGGVQVDALDIARFVEAIRSEQLEAVEALEAEEEPLDGDGK